MFENKNMELRIKESKEISVMEERVSGYKIDKLVKKLNKMNLSNSEEIIKILYNIRLLGRSGAFVPHKRMANTLEKIGYISSANVREAFNKSDKNNYAEYLIGQYISSTNAPQRFYTPIFDFMLDWAATFNVQLV